MKKYLDKKVTNFAIGLDNETLNQFENCIKEDFVFEASLMPDAHKGYVAPIGSVLKTKKFIVPSWVGYDIGCGVIAVKISNSKSNIGILRQNSIKIYKEVLKVLPMGKGVLNEKKIKSDELEKLLKDLKEKTKEKKLFNYVFQNSKYHIGTLGSGNHFAEINYIENEIWICVHSGSRGIGKKVATYFMKKASNNNEDFEDIFSLKADENNGVEYLNFMNYCLEFALLNRLKIAEKIFSVLEKHLKNLNFELVVNKNHNHIEIQNEFFIHRKGATPSNKNELGIIPANMKEGCFLVKGLGNSDFLNSSSHGAGRVMSRKDAKKNICLEDFKKDMKGIVSNTTEKIIDESSFVYKNINEVMEKQKESVKILKQLKPIINFKGT